ncbi:MAG TPA: hypothetical protein VFF68_02640 [Anaerolineaceae bacterium]|nr:hypothetical protein [Anaerolineaceae bacterium]
MLNATWFGVSKRDHRAVDLYRRHYSSKKNGKSRSDWLRYGITTPSKSITLLTSDGLALFVWIKQQYVDSGEIGVNCAVFRNEGPRRASDLILEAEALAWDRWPAERLYTYVDPRAINIIKVHGKPVPGFCFIKAGWRECGETARGLIVLEKLP